MGLIIPAKSSIKPKHRLNQNRAAITGCCPDPEKILVLACQEGEKRSAKGSLVGGDQGHGGLLQPEF